jgi:hypothetical protein
LDEAFFSIDEFGPFAVKTKPGLMLSSPGEQRVEPLRVYWRAPQLEKVEL